jgi:hypothetical protein
MPKITEVISRHGTGIDSEPIQVNAKAATVRKEIRSSNNPLKQGNPTRITNAPILPSFLLRKY